MEHNSTNGLTTNGGSSGGHERQASVVESTVGDSFVLVNDVLEQYRKHLPRRKGHRRKVAEGCGGISCISWFFLFLSLLQFLAVSGIQITIAVLGRFSESRLPEYVDCLEASLRRNPSIPSDFSISANSTFPRFGEDKAIYVYFFIALVLYNFGLCIYAMTQKNIVEVYAFMVLNILAMAYACLQVYQFRGFGGDCDPITIVGYLAMANVFILLIFTFLFSLLSLTMYVEFGWKTYRLLNCNPAMRYYYRVYQILMSLIKIVILFLLMFTVGQCILILTPENYEFGVTVVLSFAILVLAYPIVYLVVTYEWRFGYVLMFAASIVLILYCVFKIVRFATLSCPLCIDRTNEVAIEVATLRNVTGLQSTNITDVELQALFSLDRVEDFGNLIMLGSLVLLFVLVAIVVFIHHLRFYNKGLKEYFDEQQPNIYLNKHCLKKCHSSGAYDVDDGPSKGRTLHLETLNKRHKIQASQNSTTRDSRLEETVNASQPDFDGAISSKRGQLKRFSSIEESYSVPQPDFNMAPPTVGVHWDNK